VLGRGSHPVTPSPEYGLGDNKIVAVKNSTNIYLLSEYSTSKIL